MKTSGFIESTPYHYITAGVALLAVFAEPVTGMWHFAIEPVVSDTLAFHSVPWVQAIEFLAVLVFGGEFVAMLRLEGKRYLLTVNSWINLLVVLSFAVVYLMPHLMIPDPLLLRVLRLGRMFARVGLAHKMTPGKSDVMSEDSVRAHEDDIRFTFVLVIALVILMGTGGLSPYEGFMDPFRELFAYSAIIFAMRYKVRRNRARVRDVVLHRIQRISEENKKKLELLLGHDFNEAFYSGQMEQRKAGGFNEFDHLLEQINLIFMNLKRFVSDRALREARGEQVITEDQPVAMMFTDLESFTRKTQVMGNAILGPLGRYFESMVKVILKEKGDVERFIGDAIFSYFLNPSEPKESCNNCFDAAMGMVRAGEELRDQPDWEESFQGHVWEEFKEFKTRFGLHWGCVTAGTLGSDAEQVRDETTLMGDEVNLTARLEALNKKYGTYLMISGEFYRHLSEDRQRHCRLVDFATVKGREDKPLKLYTVDLDPKDPEFLEYYVKGLDLYFEGKWYEALLSLEKAFSIDPLDGPNRNIMKRIHSSRSFSLNAIQHLNDKLGEKIPDLLPFKKEIELTVVKEAFAPPHGFIDRGGYWRWEQK